jgi:hypothetical protein
MIYYGYKLTRINIIIRRKWREEGYVIKDVRKGWLWFTSKDLE